MARVTAFQYTAAWQAITPVVSSLVAVMLTLWSTGRNERRRAQYEAKERAADRQHELSVRELEVREARQARFHDHRLAAYREVGLQILTRRRLGLEAWAARLTWEAVKRQDDADLDDGREMKAISDAAIAAYRQAGDALEEALVALYPVATGAARAEVEHVREAITTQVTASLQLFELDDVAKYKDTYARYTEAEARGREAEERLYQSMSKELGVDE